MINRILQISFRHRWTVIVLAVIACFGGWTVIGGLPLDATPDLSDRQVIILSHWDRSPDIVEDQVSYPIVAAMLGAPHVKNVRGISDYGSSYVYVTFDDSTDLYWARSRTVEYLSAVLPTLPAGVKTELGPDATSLGWIYQYAIYDPSGKHGLDELRSVQDWSLRYHLRSVPGVADVATVGGYERQYQVNLDPHRLRAYDIPVSRVVEAVRNANSESSGRLLEFAGTEYMIRSRGYAQSLQDFADIPLGISEAGSQIRIGDVGRVAFGPDLRRGTADLNGRGQVVSGIVIMRDGANALDVITRVKRRLNEITSSLPAGVRLMPVYDRSELIQNTIGTARRTLIEIAITIGLIVIIFLRHFPSAVVPLITTPITVILTLVTCRFLGLSANVMSLAGVALAFSELADASIIVVEQIHKRLEAWDRNGRVGFCQDVVLAAIKEVCAPAFFALLVMAVSFLPVLLLPGEEGRMFRPLAYTKTLTLVIAAILAITFDPALRLILTRTKPLTFRPFWLCRWTNSVMGGAVQREDRHPVTRSLMRAYEPAICWCLNHKIQVIVAALLLISLTVPAFLRLGTESLPPFDEGAILYMPSTLPGISVAQAEQLLHLTNGIIAGFPEVDRVIGKAGRAETATDPAPLSMLETTIILKQRDLWPRVRTWYSDWAPAWIEPALRHITPDTISTDELISQMNAALRIPGLTNAWTMPIRGRIDMLSTGMRTPLGLKVSGPRLEQIQQIAIEIEGLLRQVRGTRSALAERNADGHFVDVVWDREQLARYGISITDAQSLIENAVGGSDIGTVVSGRERYPVNVRYNREFRSDLDSMSRLTVAASGSQVPLSNLAQIRVQGGPSMIRDENGLPTSYVFLDTAGRDPESYINEADHLLREKLHLPAGYTFEWSGQYPLMQQVMARLRVVVPVTVCLVALLLYINTRSMIKTIIVLLAMPFSAVGAIWFLYFAGYNLSAAVWVGLIALLGIDAETGVFMLLYLDLAYHDASRRGKLRDFGHLREAVMQGAAKRLRPKLMTFACTCIGLLPLLWATGAGADLMKRIAAPMVGGIVTSFVLELFIYPVIYELWRGRNLRQPAGIALDLMEPAHAAISGD